MEREINQLVNAINNDPAWQAHLCYIMTDETTPKNARDGTRGFYTIKVHGGRGRVGIALGYLYDFILKGDAQELAAALRHELAHAEQHKRTGYKTRDQLSPPQKRIPSDEEKKAEYFNHPWEIMTFARRYVDDARTKLNQAELLDFIRQGRVEDSWRERISQLKPEARKRFFNYAYQYALKHRSKTM